MRKVEKPAELQDSLESSVSCLVLKCKAPSSFESHGDFQEFHADRCVAEGQKAYSKYLRRIRHPRFAKDFGLRDQIWRASVSIMANIDEGFGRSGSAEFHQYLAIAKGSTCEVVSHMYVALDLRYVSQQDFDRLCGLAEETANLIGGLMKYLGQSGIRGAKYSR